ncbi:hypothetical protein SAMN04487880_2592 [Marinobacter sp. es.042]|nr:hypothetical protein SAMN04487880_2592 [Marinobacter sp. es.042]
MRSGCLSSPRGQVLPSVLG